MDQIRWWLYYHSRWVYPCQLLFWRKNCKNRVLLEEQHINNCFPHKQNDVGTALCATTEIPKGGLIGQYLGAITREGKHTPKGNYTAVILRPDNENGYSNLWVDSEKCGNLTRFVNHSCNPNCVWEQRQVNGCQTLWIRTTKLIHKKKPITIDYGEEASDLFSNGFCQCGEDCCRFIQK